MFINILEDFLRFDGAIAINCFKRHRHVVLSNNLAPRSPKMNCEFIRIVFDDIDNRETIVLHEMPISTVPNLLGYGAAIVKVHPHTLLLRSLTSKDIRRDGLLNFCFS